MVKQHRQTSYLVLHKQPYGDTSLIVGGLTPAYGYLRCLIRGARKISRKHFPVVDIFRVLDITLTVADSDLHSCRSVDLIKSYEAVAADMTAYQTAGWLSLFIQRNILAETSCEKLYQAVITALKRMDYVVKERGLFKINHGKALICGVVAVFLEENGLYPYGENDTTTAEQRRILLEMGLGKRRPLKFSEEKWDQTYQWLAALMQHAGCSVPRLPF